MILCNRTKRVLIIHWYSELNQVWTNLIDNAIDAIGKHGNICIRTRQESIIVEIADNGPGIPKKIQQRIFEPFFTTKELGKRIYLKLRP